MLPCQPIWAVKDHSHAHFFYHKNFRTKVYGCECEHLGYMKAWVHRSSVLAKRLEAPSSLRQSHSNMGWLGTSHSPISAPASLHRETHILKTMTWKTVYNSFNLYLTSEICLDTVPSDLPLLLVTSSLSSGLHIVQPENCINMSSYIANKLIKDFLSHSWHNYTILNVICMQYVYWSIWFPPVLILWMACVV